MAGSALVKYFNDSDSRGKSLYWGRAQSDGLPFRGKPSLLTEREFEERVVKVPDYRNGFFDTIDPEENKAFTDIMERCTSQWFALVYIKRFWKGSTKHYVEWVEFYLEDGSRAPYAADKDVPDEQRYLAENPR